MKKGQLSKEERKMILEKGSTMTAEQLSKKMDRSVKTIEKTANQIGVVLKS